MGYEVIFHFKQRDKDTGEYSGKESFKKRVGDPYEDTPVENLANVVLRQLARRDIFVEDVEIYEITKKKINFKESRKGVTIKNKKFSLDDDFEVKSEEELQENIQDYRLSKNEKQDIKDNVPISQLRPIKKMLYAPEPQQHIKLLKQGVKLTHNKSYEIFKIEKHMNEITEIYSIIDDNGREKQISDDYFVPFQNIDEGVNDSGLSDDGLNWGGVVNDNLPSIR